MAALTNDPGVRGMQSLNAMQAAATAMFSQPTEEPMNELLKALLANLGLPENTTAEAALTAVNSMKATADAARAALQLKPEDGAAAVQAACTALHGKATAAANPDPSQFVPIGVVDELKSNLAVLTARQLEADIEAAVQPALADGRLLPAQEPWARELGKQNMAQLTAYLKTAQPIAALTATQTGGKTPAGQATGAHGLTADELAVCTAMSITPEAFVAQKTAAA
ncbi:Mu-like prophage I protein [compost metagenome]